VVPTYFVAQRHWLYSFSLPGQKIEWMRANPLVCLEVDDAKGPDDWRSIVVYGRYHELSERADIEHSIELLQARVMWWEPGVRLIQQGSVQATKPVFFRISVDRVTGRVATAY
jgi:nitroimidazol reductase NimA-like FMN-containing flavoprotein (pyridoxamine 5'-phosphate oxidase superfamily)